MSRADTTPYFLAPFPGDRFFTEYWERAILLVRRNDPDYFRGILDFRELDRLATSIRIPATNLNLAQGDEPLPLSTYTVDGVFVDHRRLLELHQEGATIIMRSVEQWSPDLNRLRIAAEQFFEFEAQINVYLTPGSEKSTPPHWDTHDLVILQVAGSKRWRLFKGRRTLPLAEERFRIGEDYIGPDVEEVVLHSGDSLYLPRGVIHEPVAETYSVHVSIGIHCRRYCDLVEEALRLLAAREGSPLRRALPRGCLVDGHSLDTNLVKDLLDPALLNQAAVILRRRFLDNVSVDLEGRLKEISDGPRIDPSARYVRREGIVLEASQTPKGLRVAVGKQTIDLPRALKGAVHYINTHASFTADELPGPKANNEQVALCVALREIGVLKIDDGTIGD